MKHKFTRKMEAALSHYSQDPERDKTAAYRSAYDCANMQSETVRRRAHDLFAHPLMAQGVQTVQGVALQHIGIDAAWVLKRAALVADFNISAFIAVDPETKERYFDFGKATRDDWYCLTVLGQHTAALDPKRRYTLSEVKLKPGHQLKALTMVGECASVQAFQKNVGIGGLDGGPIEIRSLSDFYEDENSG